MSHKLMTIFLIFCAFVLLLTACNKTDFPVENPPPTEEETAAAASELPSAEEPEPSEESEPKESEAPEPEPEPPPRPKETAVAAVKDESSVKKPVASGVYVKKTNYSGESVIDYSNSSQGYIMMKTRPLRRIRRIANGY